MPGLCPGEARALSLPAWASAKRGAARDRKPIEETPANNREPALRLWRQAFEPRGTLVEAYLRNRCLELPGEAANEAIRFHPDCPFRNERFPAMVCLIRNIVSNEPQGIHRTALTAGGPAVKRGGKTFRLSLGSTSGGAINIDPDEDVTQGICIGEGLETCLSGRLIGYRPVWSVLTTSGVAGFPLLPGIDRLTIFGSAMRKEQAKGPFGLVRKGGLRPEKTC